METSINTLPAQGQALVQKATLKANDLRNDAAPLVKKAAATAQSMSRQGLDAIGDIAGQAVDAASSATDSIVTYTKKNPVKSLVIAAACGALVYRVIRAFTPSRD